MAFAGDLGYVVSAPLRLNRVGAMQTALVLGATGVIYAMDEEILARLQRGDSDAYDAVADAGDALEPAGFMPNSLIFWSGSALVSGLAGWEGLETASLQIIESHLIGGGIRNVSEILIGRRRPHEGEGSESFEFNGGTSFPSGHTAVMFETATVLSHHARRLPVTLLCYGAAGLVGVQRIESESHWPSDVFLTAVMSTVIAQTVVRRWEAREAKAEGVRVGFAPYGAGAALTVRF